MKLSGLIEQLQRALNTHGDKDVIFTYTHGVFLDKHSMTPGHWMSTETLPSAITVTPSVKYPTQVDVHIGLR